MGYRTTWDDGIQDYIGYRNIWDTGLHMRQGLIWYLRMKISCYNPI